MTQQHCVTEHMRAAQDRLCNTFENLDGQARFITKTWERPGGGGGTARVMSNGAVFEKAGINFSAVHGEQTPPSLWQSHPETKGLPFFACGVSMVMHPQNPFVPAFHANFRYFESGAAAWFGGGMDMTPSYGDEDDAIHFHATLRDYCARHGLNHAQLKATCDAYFTLKHRNEMRGIGGIFFDEVALSFEPALNFVMDGFDVIVDAYAPIVRRRMHRPWGERERNWQLYRRGRYVEFNLVYDRGTVFGLQTGGNIEAILMSLPPLARWEFDYTPEPGSPEAKMLSFLQPRDWAHLAPAQNAS